MKQPLFFEVFRFINLWKYWNMDYDCVGDLTIIRFDIHKGSASLVILNVGFSISWSQFIFNIKNPEVEA